MWRALKEWWTVQRIKRMRRRMSPAQWEWTWAMYDREKRRESNRRAGSRSGPLPSRHAAENGKGRRGAWNKNRPCLGIPRAPFPKVDR